MTDWFFTIINMSVTAMFLLLFTLLWRVLLRQKLTPAFCCVLWIPFLFRLLLPFSVQSAWSVWNLTRVTTRPNTTAFVSVEYLKQSAYLVDSASQQSSNFIKMLLTGAALVWAAGALMSLCGLAARHVNMARCVRYAKRYQLSLAQVYATAGLRKEVPVFCSAKIACPMAVGIFRPCVVLPEQYQAVSGTEFNNILLHELCHLKRHDPLFLLIANIALCLHWFNPLVWLAQKKISADIERACDEKVLALTDEKGRIAYAQTLADYSARAVKDKRSSGWAMFAESDVVRRVRGILKYQKLSRIMTGVFCLFTLVFILCTMTNPIIPKNTYIPSNTFFISAKQKNVLKETAKGFASALERGDSTAILNASTMDAGYFAPLYEPLDDLRLTVEQIHIYYNSATTAEAYYAVNVEQGAGVYAEGRQNLVAHITATEYRSEPFVDCLMQQPKYEQIKLITDENAAVRLARRLLATPPEISFSALSLDGTTIANICMASAMEEKHEAPPFTPQRMQELALAYFGIRDFTCDDPSVYDAATNTFFYTKKQLANAAVTNAIISDSAAVVQAEIYEDPLKLFVDKTMQITFDKTKQ